jgi:tetratricopeptide (TPR) repeat protein
MRRAQLALTQNDGKAVYDNHRSALGFYPGMSGYNTSFATVNLSLASALSQKSDLTDTDRENIAQLIQQSVQSGKSATSLRPNDAAAWVTLATTYQNLINVAEGSDQFTVDAYARAISLDRANPQLRIQFGGLLMQLGNSAKDEQVKTIYLDRAQNEFQTAIQLKPDYGNAYYNLAKLLESRGKYEEAWPMRRSLIPRCKQCRRCSRTG